MDKAGVNIKIIRQFISLNLAFFSLPQGHYYQKIIILLVLQAGVF